MSLVLDASVAVSWASPNQDSLASDDLLTVVLHDFAIVPAIWLFEVTSVLAKPVEKGNLPYEEAKSFLLDLQSFDMRIERQLPESAMLLELSIAHRLSGYDAAYLELALRSGLPLATFDRKLANAARLAGINVLPN